MGGDQGARLFDARLSYTGTHQGKLLGIAPTGKRFECAGAAIFMFSDGPIHDVWVLGDVDGLTQQPSID